MTFNNAFFDMSESLTLEDEDMARRISQRDIVRAGLEGKPATKIVARAVELDGGRWAAQFAVPGKIPDYTRHDDGTVRTFEHETAATFHAMAAAIGLFNMPREHLGQFGNNRMGNAGGDIRPAKMTPVEMSTAMSAAELNTSDLVFLLDKPAKRVLGWSNGEDVPHEVRLLLETWAKFDDTVDFAFERTNAAIAEAGMKKGR